MWGWHGMDLHIHKWDTFLKWMEVFYVSPAMAEYLWKLMAGEHWGLGFSVSAAQKWICVGTQRMSVKECLLPDVIMKGTVNECIRAHSSCLPGGFGSLVLHTSFWLQCGLVPGLLCPSVPPPHTNSNSSICLYGPGTPGWTLCHCNALDSPHQECLADQGCYWWVRSGVQSRVRWDTCTEGGARGVVHCELE